MSNPNSNPLACCLSWYLAFVVIILAICAGGVIIVAQRNEAVRDGLCLVSTIGMFLVALWSAARRKG